MNRDAGAGHLLQVPIDRELAIVPARFPGIDIGIIGVYSIRIGSFCAQHFRMDPLNVSLPGDLHVSGVEL